MKLSAPVATLITSFLVTVSIVFPPTPASAEPPCYSVSGTELTNDERVAGEPCTGAVVIDGSVTSIAVDAFHDNTGITSVVIPSTVTSIGNYAFNGNTALTSVTLNNGLLTIGNNAFDAFGGEPILSSIEIPSTVTSIGRYAFRHNTALTRVTLNNGLLTIGDNAFDGNTRLRSINIPSSVTSIGRYTFQDNTALTSVTLNSGLLTIGDHAFEDNIRLRSINIPSTVTSIGRYTFNGSTALTSVTLNSGLLTIGDHAFQNTSLTSAVIPSTVTSLGRYTFNGSTTLQSVGIGPNVTTIEEYAFQDTGLTSVIIPSSVISIETNAFRGNTELTSVGLGANVVTIGDNSFKNAIALTCLRASGAVPTTLASNAFYNTPLLNTVFYTTGTSGWDSPFAGLTTTAQTLTPGSGTQWGGTEVTLTSCGLNTVSRVLIGGVSASFSVTSDGSLTAVTPIGSPGVVDVEIEDSVGSRQKVATYTFVSAPAPTPPAPPAPSVEPTALPVVTPSAPIAPVVVEQTMPALGNPIEPTRVAPGVLLVSEAQAQATAPRVMRNAPAETIRDAPVVQSQTGSATALVTPGLTRGVIYQVRIKVQGEYQDLGFTQAAADGDAALPVFRLSRSGSYTIVITNPIDGSVQYIKMRVNKRR